MSSATAGASPAPCISFLSDYGDVDEFAGVCRAVMAGIAPGVPIIDITHGVPPHDIRAGGLTLVRAAQYLPEGVLLAVVDPGVGTGRRAVAVQLARGFLVGPDNGLLAPTVAMAGGPERIVELTNTEYQLDSPGPTFAGRDVMAPAAAYLASGVPLESLGPEIDAAHLMPGTLPVATEEGAEVRAEVLWVDRFGNCQLNVDPDTLRRLGAEPGGPVEIAHGADTPRLARWVTAYGDARPGELVLVVDSYGLASLALDRSSAARECTLRAGSEVTVITPGEAT
ncbi:MAG: SAM-dependent chlorinase/fluorinase [Acidimicrobiia bacterium]|nr:SAM-dependent chlorinase/fluorinase [Acidimicrobiia bacterium]